MTDTLYSLMTELDEFIDAIPDDLNPDEYVHEFDAIMKRLENKVDACSSYFDFIEGRLAELKIKQDRLAKAVKSYKSKKEKMQQYLINCIKLGDSNEIRSSNIVITIRNNPPSLKLDAPLESKSYKQVDPLLIPLELKDYIVEKTVYVIDNVRLKNELKAGEKSFKSAHLERKETIKIKDI